MIAYEMSPSRRRVEVFTGLWLALRGLRVLETHRGFDVGERGCGDRTRALVTVGENPIDRRGIELRTSFPRRTQERVKALRELALALDASERAAATALRNDRDERGIGNVV